MKDLIEISKSYYNSALELVEENKISKAIEILEKSLKCYCKNTEVLNLIGLCEYVSCNFDKAYFYWDKSLELCKKNNKADNYLKMLNSREFDVLLSKYNLAIDNLDNSNYKQTIKILKEIIKSNKDLIEPYIIIGLCYYELKEYNLAKDYLEEAKLKDKEDERILNYLEKVNSESKKKSVFKKIISNKAIYVAVFLVIMGFSFYYQNNRYIEVSNKYKEYESKINEVSNALDKSNAKNDMLKTELESKNEKEDIYNNDNELFKSAVINYNDKEYDKAIEKFQSIINKATEQNIVSEAIYYIAVCYERSGNYGSAEENYIRYIKKYKEKNYYDDALYNCALMLYKNGEVYKAKRFAYELKQEAPNSIFVNSKIKEILDSKA